MDKVRPYTLDGPLWLRPFSFGTSGQHGWELTDESDGSVTVIPQHAVRIFHWKRAEEDK